MAIYRIILMIGLFVFSSCDRFSKKPPEISEKVWAHSSRLAADVSFSLREAIQSGKEYDASFTINPTKDCASISITVRPIDGIEIIGSNEMKFDDCKSGKVLTAPIRVRAPQSKTAGYIVLDLKITELDGRTSQTTETFPLASEGANYKRAAAGENRRRLDQDETGAPVIKLKTSVPESAEQHGH